MYNNSNNHLVIDHQFWATLLLGCCNNYKMSDKIIPSSSDLNGYFSDLNHHHNNYAFVSYTRPCCHDMGVLRHCGHANFIVSTLAV